MEQDNTLIEMTADVVAAYVGKNALPSSELPALIRDVHGALAQIHTGQPEVKAQEPAVPVRRSVGNDMIVCLEDGKKFKSLKRHLQTHHGLTPQQYREKWALPADYPMVAPAYAKQRSDLAKKTGLGRKAAKKK
jgi:predicted transcriptional regulator